MAASAQRWPLEDSPLLAAAWYLGEAARANHVSADLLLRNRSGLVARAEKEGVGLPVFTAEWLALRKLEGLVGQDEEGPPKRAKLLNIDSSRSVEDVLRWYEAELASLRGAGSIKFVALNDSVHHFIDNKKVALPEFPALKNLICDDSCPLAMLRIHEAKLRKDSNMQTAHESPLGSLCSSDAAATSSKNRCTEEQLEGPGISAADNALQCGVARVPQRPPEECQLPDSLPIQDNNLNRSGGQPNAHIVVPSNDLNENLQDFPPQNESIKFTLPAAPDLCKRKLQEFPIHENVTRLNPDAGQIDAHVRSSYSGNTFDACDKHLHLDVDKQSAAALGHPCTISDSYDKDVVSLGDGGDINTVDRRDPAAELPCEIIRDADPIEADTLSNHHADEDLRSPRCNDIHGPSQVDEARHSLCVKCNTNGLVLRCCICLLVVHESCLKCSATFDDGNRFICPPCEHRRVALAYRREKKIYTLLKKKFEHATKNYKAFVSGSYVFNVQQQAPIQCLNIAKGAGLDNDHGHISVMDKGTGTSVVDERGYKPNDVDTVRTTSGGLCELYKDKPSVQERKGLEPLGPSAAGNYEPAINNNSRVIFPDSAGRDHQADEAATEAKMQCPHDSEEAPPPLDSENLHKRAVSFKEEQPAHRQISRKNEKQLIALDDRYTRRTRTAYLPWTNEEVAALKEAYGKVVAGGEDTVPWKKIWDLCRGSIDESRQPADLKSKWWNLKKNGLV